MKYKWSRYWIWIIMFLSVEATLSFLKISNSISTDVFVGVTVALVTVLISVVNHYHESDKFFKELFTEFNIRYDAMNGFLNQLKSEEKVDGEIRQKIIDYLNLCAEEFMWVKRGRIPSHIWQSWKNGIRFHLKKESIKAVYEEEKIFWKTYYYDFFKDIDKG